MLFLNVTKGEKDAQFKQILAGLNFFFKLHLLSFLKNYELITAQLFETHL